MSKKYQLLLLVLFVLSLIYYLWLRPVPFEQLYAKVDPAKREALQTFRRQYPSQQIEVNGAAWEYLVMGRGEETILFLHGLAGSYDIWQQQMTALADRYRLVSLTYGPADNLAAFAEAIVAILDAEQIERVHVVGSSLGGYLAQYLAAAHPERIDSLVLANTFPPNDIIAADYQTIGRILPYTPEWLIMAVMRANYRHSVYPTSENSELVLAFLREISYQMSKANVLGRYRAVIEPFTPPAADLPILIIESDNDPLVKPELRRQLKETYPQAAVHTLASAGHFPYLNQAALYTQLLEDFWATIQE